MKISNRKGEKKSPPYRGRVSEPDGYYYDLERSPKIMEIPKLKSSICCCGLDPMHTIGYCEAMRKASE